MNFTEAIVLAVEMVKAWIQSGGVKWDHVSDKPFVKVGGDTLTWDGNTAGLDNLLKFGVPCYKVSDAVFSASDVAEGFSLTLNDGSRGDFAPGESVGDFEGFGVALSNYIVSFNEADAATIGIAAGTYFISDGAIYPASLTIPGYTGFAKEQIDPKVLPESLQFGKTTVQSDTLEWDGNTEGLVSAEGGLYKVSDATLSADDVENGCVVEVCSGGEIESVEATIDTSLVGMVQLIAGSFVAISVTDAETYGFPETGTFFMKIEETYVSSLTIPGYSGFTKTEVKTIDPDLLPAGVGVGGAFIVNVTEADDGTISADKTFAEISAAIEAGQSVVCREDAGYMVTYFNLYTYVAGQAIGFNTVQMTPSDYTTQTLDTFIYGVLTCTASDTWAENNFSGKLAVS